MELPLTFAIPNTSLKFNGLLALAGYVVIGKPAGAIAGLAINLLKEEEVLVEEDSTPPSIPEEVRDPPNWTAG